MRDARLDELEIKISLIEDSVEKINHSIFRQQCEMDRLQEQMHFLYGKMRDRAEISTDPNEPQDEIPPHY